MSGEKESYSIFRVAGEYFAIKAIKVIEIMMLRHVTPVPKAPGYAKGLFNHRGRILSLIDSSVRLNLPSIEVGDNTPIMVVHYADEHKELEFGVIVNEVIEVLEVGKEQIQAYPSEEAAFDISFIEGIFKYKDVHVTMLNIKKTYDIK